jgi:zinc protease
VTLARLARLAALSSALYVASVPCLFRASAQGVGPFGKPPVVSRLKNGLTVVSIPWRSPGICAYFTLVRVGARDEVEPGHSGFAHLFEHMMFRGTKRFPKDVYEQRVQDLGADNNAYTTQDFTLYTLTGPEAALGEMVELEADRFQNLAYDEASFRTETGAVLGEYNKSAASPSLKLWETLSELSFTQHTYGHTTIGYLADVLTMPDKFAYSQAFFRRFYTPDNTTIVVAGDVAHAAVRALVATHYGAWQGRRDQPLIATEPEPLEAKQRHLDWDGIASPQLVIGFRGPAFAQTGGAAALGEGTGGAAALRETAALEVIHGLGFGPASPLYESLVVNEQRLLTLDSWSNNFSRDPGLFVISAELSPNASFGEISQRIQSALDGIARGEGKERVDAVRSHLTYDFTMRLETASDVADAFAQFVALTGRVTTMADYLEALSQVTPEDVARAAAKYLTATRRTLVTLAPRAKPTERP